MSRAKKRTLLALDLPNEDTARALAEALAKRLAEKNGRRIEVEVTDQNGNEVCCPAAEVVRH